MRPFASRRGSALLVVLGMLSFMLFSGLAFSVYLRQQRLPTSFLRRVVTTRQLTKAALAEAMNHIDLAIGNDPHPNVRAGTPTANVLTNVWSHRVFIGVGTTAKPKWDEDNDSTDGNVYPVYADPDSEDTDDPGTVPTMPLEGLAYVPPNLINEVRYYSQRTPTAKWHSFWFDSGRYAYTAVDVSDYFDVNRVFANKPRASSAGRRISFAHLFETGSGHTGLGSGAEAWDTFMKAYRTVNENTDEITFSYAPFVSLADCNAAIGSATIGKMCSPFYSFVNSGKVYDCGDSTTDGRYTDETAEKISLMTFVTDSWYPQPDEDKTESDVEGIDSVDRLDLEAHQPFRYDELNASSQPNLEIFADMQSDIVNSGSGRPNLLNHLCVLGLATLWDYLDVNRVPLSLAIPTLERTPMVVGVQPSTLPKLGVSVEKNADQPNSADKVEYDQGAGKGYSTRTVAYYLLKESFDTVAANVLLAYPFLKRGVDDNKNFTVDGRMSLFFSKSDVTMGLSTGLSGSEGLTAKDLDEGRIYDNAVVAFRLGSQSVSSDIIASDPAKPVLKVTLQSDDELAGPDKLLLFKITYRWQSHTWDNENERWQLVKADPLNDANDIQSVEGQLAPVNRDGTVDTSFVEQSALKQCVIGGQTRIRPHVAVWVRVKHADQNLGEKTVDLVPACFTDDQTENGIANEGALPGLDDENRPLLRYDVSVDGSGDGMLDYSVNGLNALVKQSAQLKIARPCAVVQDPRYNYDPRNWYTVGNNALDADIWIDETAKMLGNGGRDSDFYLFTSDQGYMQSVYELAFLPRMTGFTSTSKTHGSWGQYPFSRHFDGTFTRTSLGESWSDAIDNTWQDGSTPMMWTTYRCYAENGIAADPFDLVGLVSGDTGAKVNPYSDSCEVLMAALANTPHDWRVASTNDAALVISESEFDSVKAFNEKYAWNHYCSGGKQSGVLRWDVLYDIADNFQSKVHDTATYSGDWEAAFEDLGWGGGLRHMAGIDLDDNCSDLYSVDKKFLYGFWHDSFSVRQQLFLIFLRAEPMMVGGGVIGQAPPQLGARAVALVWRDPTKTKSTRTADGTGSSETKTYNESDIPNPHRMRILFYHTFD